MVSRGRLPDAWSHPAALTDCPVGSAVAQLPPFTSPADCSTTWHRSCGPVPDHVLQPSDRVPVEHVAYACVEARLACPSTPLGTPSVLLCLSRKTQSSLTPSCVYLRVFMYGGDSKERLMPVEEGFYRLHATPHHATPRRATWEASGVVRSRKE